MQRTHPKGELGRRYGAAAWLMAAALVFLCLSGCSGEVYAPNGGTLTLAPAESSTDADILDLFADSEHTLRGEFLNTGKSDAILLRVGATVILVDTGDEDDYETIRDRLSARGITAIDHLILTHFDNDHIGSAAQILQNFRVDRVYMPDYVRDSARYRRLMAALEASTHTEVCRVTADTVVELSGGEMRIQPTALYESGLSLGDDDSHPYEENDFSLITEISFGQTQLLLMGDAEQARLEEFLAGKDEVLSYDLIKIPHHGGYDKAVKDLLARCEGLAYCVVHAAEAADVERKLISAMKDSGAEIFYTYDGHGTFVSDGERMAFVQSGG